MTIGANGSRKWSFVFRWQGRLREQGLGRAADVSLAQARQLAEAARALIREGKSPIEEKRTARAERRRGPTTFADVARAYIASMGKSWRNEKHLRLWQVSLGLADAARGGEAYAKPLGAVAIEAVTTEHILAVLKPIWGKKHEAASRLRARIEAVIATPSHMGFGAARIRRDGAGTWPRSCQLRRC
jgi:hypothetical protein